MSELAKVPGSVLAYVTESTRRLQANPGDAEGLFARALIFAALGKEDEAREAILALAHVAPRHPAVVQARTNGMVDMNALAGWNGSVLRYVNACARALEKNPKDPDALFTRAAILATLGQHQDALHTLETLAKIEPQYPAVWRLKARLYKEIGDPKTADLCVRAAERFEAEQEARDTPRKPTKLGDGDQEFLRKLLLSEGR